MQEAHARQIRELQEAHAEKIRALEEKLRNARDKHTAQLEALKGALRQAHRELTTVYSNLNNVHINLNPLAHLPLVRKARADITQVRKHIGDVGRSIENRLRRP